MFHKRKPKKTFFIFKYKFILLSILLSSLCFLSIITIEFDFTDFDNEETTFALSTSENLTKSNSYSFLIPSECLVSYSWCWNNP